MAAVVQAIRKKKKAEREAREAANDGMDLPEDAPPLPRPGKQYPEVFRGGESIGCVSPHWGRVLPMQPEVLRFYNNPCITWGVASVIIFNFLAICIEKDIDPFPCPDEPTLEEPCMQQHKPLWDALDSICNVIFIIELGTHYYGAGPRRFWCGVGNGWNIFDFIVVMVGAFSLCQIPLGSFSQLKMLRTFRVFRLFKRIKSLNKIIVSLIRSIPGVINAFIIMTIFMCIYAILAVDYFRSFGNTCTVNGGCYELNEYVTRQGNVIEGYLYYNVSSITGRGYTIGDEYYGSFTRALYTLFQVLTGESWSEAIARPLIFGYPGSEGGAPFVAFFFVSFLLLMQVVLINVVVAVLLEKFVEEPEKPGEEEASSTAPSAAKPAASPAFFTPAAATPPAAFTALEARVRALDTKLDLILERLPPTAKGLLA